jgi:hypothetical protein
MPSLLPGQSLTLSYSRSLVGHIFIFSILVCSDYLHFFEVNFEVENAAKTLPKPLPTGLSVIFSGSSARLISLGHHC